MPATRKFLTHLLAAHLFSHPYYSRSHTQITPTPPTPLIFTKKFQGNQITTAAFLNHQALLQQDNLEAAANFSNVQ